MPLQAPRTPQHRVLTRTSPLFPHLLCRACRGGDRQTNAVRPCCWATRGTGTARRSGEPKLAPTLALRQTASGRRGGAGAAGSAGSEPAEPRAARPVQSAAGARALVPSPPGQTPPPRAAPVLCPETRSRGGFPQVAKSCRPKPRVSDENQAGKSTGGAGPATARRPCRSPPEHPRPLGGRGLRASPARYRSRDGTTRPAPPRPATEARWRDPKGRGKRSREKRGRGERAGPVPNMAAYLQWRRFVFFDRETVKEPPGPDGAGGKPFALPPGIAVCDSGRGSLVFGDILHGGGRWRRRALWPAWDSVGPGAAAGRAGPGRVGSGLRCRRVPGAV